MPALSGNSCQVITLFPMGVECVVTDAYTPFTQDGAINLIITGGTPPYSVTYGPTTTPPSSTSPITFTSQTPYSSVTLLDSVGCSIPINL